MDTKKVDGRGKANVFSMARRSLVRQDIELPKIWIDSLSEFAKDVGKPLGKGYSLKLIDESKPASKDNVRWILLDRDQLGLSINDRITYKNETKTVAEWAKAYGMDKLVVYHRLRRRIPIGKALTDPVRPKATRDISGEGIAALAVSLGKPYRYVYDRIRKGMTHDDIRAEVGAEVVKQKDKIVVPVTVGVNKEVEKIMELLKSATVLLDAEKHKLTPSVVRSIAAATQKVSTDLFVLYGALLTK